MVILPVGATQLSCEMGLVVPNRDPHDVLGVPRGATFEQVRRAFHARTKVLHPDRFDRTSQPEEWHQANEMLKEVILAYNSLKNDGTASTTEFSGAQQSREESPVPPEGPTENQTARESSDGPSCGRIVFDALPSSKKKMLIERQSTDSDEFCRVKLGGIGGSYVLCALCVAWLFVLYHFVSEPRWTRTCAYAFLATSTIVGGGMGLLIIKIKRWTSAPLVPAFYVTRMYFVKTYLTEVQWWPIWQLEDIAITHHYHNGSYDQTSVRLDLPQSQELLKFRTRSSADRFIARLREFDVLLRRAVSDQNWSYLIKHDEFAGIKGLPAAAPSALWNAREKAIVGALSATFLLAWGISYSENRKSPPLYGLPPVRAETHERSDEKRLQTGLPAAKIATSDKVPKISEFEEPEHPIPATGLLHSSFDEWPVAPLTILTKDDGSGYFFKLTRLNGNKDVASFFIRSGEKLEFVVPIGKYQIKYATGSKWYGEKYLFGLETAYHKVSKVFEFRQTAQGYEGYTIELFLQQNGNLQTEQIRPSDW